MQRQNSYYPFKILIIALSLLSIISSVSFAKSFGDEYEGMSPLEWQIVRLQETIEKKIVKSLKPVIKEDEYIVEVKIGVDKEAVENPTSKKITKTKQSSKVKFTTSEASKDGEEYVIFSKLGLEAPVFGDEPVEIQNSEVELAQKAYIEMSDRYNLFKYLKTIDVNLTFDSGLSENAKGVIRKVVQGLSFNINEVVPQINLQFLDLKANQIKSNPEAALAAASVGGGGNGQSKMDGILKQQNEKKIVPKWYENFKNLDVMLGLVLSAIILAIALVIISKNFHSSSDNKQEESGSNSVQENAPDNVAENEDTGEGEDDMIYDLTKTDLVTTKITDGLERFRKANLNHYNDTILMIKNWIKTGGEQEVKALSALVLILTDTELAKIFNSLSIDERSQWKSLLHSEMSKEEISKAFTFISNKIIEMMMVPSLINDFEICDLLLDVSPSLAIKFAQKNMELGILFVNVLSANVIGEMFKIMPAELVEELIDQGADFKTEQIQQLLPSLKEQLVEVQSKREKPPFLKRILDILPSARPEIETKLYSTLLKHFTEDEVKITALKMFPRFLIPQIPDTVFKQVVAMMPLDVQIQYFASLDNDKRDISLDRFAVKGSKAREMVEVELMMITKNEVVLKKLQKDKKEILDQEFVSNVRKLIFSDMEMQREVIDQLENWLSQMKNQNEIGMAVDSIKISA